MASRNVIDFTTLKEHTPYAQYQIVDVTFGEAFTDTEIRHKLQPPTPEHVDYTILRQAQAATVFHDMSGNRKPWRDGVIILRSNVANARVTLLLTVSHTKRPLITSAPASLVSAAPPHTHDASDIISGVLDVGRIPNLDASKITSGTLDDGVIPNLSAAKITSGTLSDAVLSSNVPLLDAENSFLENIHTAGYFFELGRSIGLGRWASVTYNAGFFSATAGSTWTVDAVDLASFGYTLIGDTMLLVLWVANSSVSGTPDDLLVTLPGGFTAARTTPGMGWGVDNGTATTLNVRISSGFNQIAMRRTDNNKWAASTNNTQVRLTMALEVL